MTEKGRCKHGEFDLDTGCPLCIEERRRTVEDEIVYGLNADEPATETALALAPGADVEVMSYYDEAQKLQQYAESRVITTIEDNKSATNDLAIISKLKRSMEEKRKDYLQPFRDHIDEVNESFKLFMQPILDADNITRGKMLDFSKEQDRIRREQEEINRLKIEAAEKEAALKGKATEPVELVEVAPSTPTTISTDMGTAGQRMIRKWGLVDMALVPEEYKTLDSAKITKVVKAGIPTISGIRIYEEPTITMRAR